MYSLQLPIPLALPPSTSFGSANVGNNLFFSSSYPKTLVSTCKTNSSSLGFPLGRNQKCAVSGSYTEPAEVEAEVIMPKHVAVIMDGNRRWAKSRGLPVPDGHRAGGKALEQLFLNCLKSGVKVLTVFAFSTENWVRQKEEVDYLMDLFCETIITVTEKLMENEVRLSFIGRRDRLPQLMQELMTEAEETLKSNNRMHLVMAIDYSGRYDMTEATKKIAKKVKDGVLQVEDINDAVFEQHLATNVIDEFPNPDLMIRSSGELRVSNFMLWQLAYTELFFTKKLFPDFDDADLMEAVTAFQRRQRRFGGQK